MNIKAVLFTALLAVATNTLANVTVSPDRVIATADSAGILTVKSLGTESRFMQVEIKHVLNPATAEEKELALSADGTHSLVVTPMRFILSAGATQRLRIVNLLPVKTEDSYRIYIHSLNGGKPEQNVAITDSHGQLTGSKVGVNIIWGVAVNIAPSNPVTTLQWVEEGVLKNTGNMHVSINSVTSCHQGQCGSHPINKNLYPGAVLDIKSFGITRSTENKVEYTNPLNGKSTVLLSASGK